MLTMFNRAAWAVIVAVACAGAPTAMRAADVKWIDNKGWRIGTDKALTFADRVVEFQSGKPAAVAVQGNPQAALGAPDVRKPRDGRSVSLGCKGSITLGFRGRLIHDGEGDDLIVFEVPKNERKRLFLSSDGRHWVDFGKLTGAGGVDIGRLGGGARIYRYVRLQNDGSLCKNKTSGADIDAVALLDAPVDRIPALLRVRARGEAYDGWPTLRVQLDDTAIGEATIDSEDWQVVEFLLPTTQIGSLAIEYPNDRYGGPGHDRNLVVDRIGFAGWRLNPANGWYERYTEDDIKGRPDMNWSGRIVFRIRPEDAPPQLDVVVADSRAEAAGAEAVSAVFPATTFWIRARYPALKAQDLPDTRTVDVTWPGGSSALELRRDPDDRALYVGGPYYVPAPTRNKGTAR